MTQSSAQTTDQLAQARAGFLLQGTTLTHFCRANGIDPSRAWKALKGEHRGKRSLAIRARILEASGSVERSDG